MYTVISICSLQVMVWDELNRRVKAKPQMSHMSGNFGNRVRKNFLKSMMCVCLYTDLLSNIYCS